MARKKGTFKTGGREPGTQNKVTRDLKNWIQAMIDGNRVQLEADLKALEPRERWNIIEKLMQYTIPKMQNVQATLELDKLTEEQITKITDELLNKLDHEN